MARDCPFDQPVRDFQAYLRIEAGLAAVKSSAASADQHTQETLEAVHDTLEKVVTRLIALENVPVHFYDKAMLGLPGRDEQIEHMATTIGHMGRAGIPIFGYHWMPNGVWRTSTMTPARGAPR